MKINLSILFLFVLSALEVQAQQNSLQATTLTKDRVRQLQATEFSRLASPLNTNSVGSFASIDLSETSVDLQASFQSNKDTFRIWCFRAQGSANDDILKVLDNTKLNSLVSLSLRYSFALNNKNNPIYYYQDDVANLHKKQRDLYQKYQLDSLNIVNGTKLKGLKKSQATLESKLDKTIADRNMLAKGFGYTGHRFLYNLIILDSLNTQISLLELKKVQLTKLITHLTKESKISRLELLNLSYLTSLRNLESSIELAGYKGEWISLEYTFSHNRFFLQNHITPFEFDTISSPSHKASIGITSYNNKGPNTHLFILSGNIDFEFSDNKSSLTKIGIRRDQTFEKDSTSHVYSYINFDAYTGALKRNRFSTTFGFDAYIGIERSNTIVFHAFPRYSIRDFAPPHASLGLGIVFAVLNKEKPKTIVNAEIFSTFNDITMTILPAKKLTDKVTLGLNFSFPFTIN